MGPISFGFLFTLLVSPTIHAEEQIPIPEKGPAAAAVRVLQSYSLKDRPKYADGFDHFDYADPKAPKGGTLKVGSWNYGWTTLNPFVAGPVGIPGSNWSHQSLMTSSSDDQASLYPSVAKSLEVAKDGTYVIFNLNEKAQWNDPENDGCDPKNPPKRKPLTADDVAYSFEQQKKLGWGGANGMYAGVTSYEILGDRRIIFHLKPDEHRGAIASLGRMSLLSKAQLDQPGKGFRANPHEAPIGSGPYILDKAEKMKVTYKRVCNHWAENLPVNRGRFNFGRIEYALFDTYEARDSHFKKGDLDYMYEDRATRWPPDSWDNGRLMDEINRGDVTAHEIEFAGTKSFTGISFNTRNAALNDRHVRRALSSLYEAEFISERVRGGQGTVTNSYFPGTSSRPDADVDRLLHDLKKKFPEHVSADVLTEPPKKAASSVDYKVTARERMKTAFEEMKKAGWQLKDDPEGSGEKVWMKGSQKFPTLEWTDYDSSGHIVYLKRMNLPGASPGVSWAPGELATFWS